MNVRQFENGYATLDDLDGVNYREIAELMTIIGHPMNHSSARNYVIRIMNKFANEICKKWGLDVSPQRLEQIARDPRFQATIADIMHCIEANRRNESSKL